VASVTASGAYSTFPTFLDYRITAEEISLNEAANQSTVRVNAFIDCFTTFASSSGGSGQVNGTPWSRGSTTFNAPGTIQVFTADVVITHNADGSGSYGISGTSSMAGWGSATTNLATLTLTNFVRPPLAPASCTVSVSGRNATVTSGVADATGRPAITSYQVERTNNDGVTWSGSVFTMDGSRQAIYTSLDGGKFYKFRTRAVNSEGPGAWTESASTFIPAGGRRWTGSAWTPTQTAKRWNGSSWVDISTAKRWNGSAWIDLT
jgi:hypothetical protein